AFLREPDEVRQRNAADWLRTAPVDAARRREVALALNPLLDKASTREAALGALPRWVTRDNIAPLVKLLDETSPLVWGPAMDALGETKDEQAAEPLAKKLLDFGKNGRAKMALRALGGIGEKEVLKYLHHKNLFARTAAAELLRGYGTDKDTIIAQTLSDL